MKSQFVLDALAQKEELTVEQEELTEHLIRRAQQSGMQPQDFVNQVMQGGQIGVLFSEVRRGKALAQLLESVKITDASGNDVDLAVLDEDEAAEAAEVVDEDDEDYGYDDGVDTLDEDEDEDDDEEEEEEESEERAAAKAAAMAEAMAAMDAFAESKATPEA